jgi:hypothetical protein
VTKISTEVRKMNQIPRSVFSSIILKKGMEKGYQINKCEKKRKLKQN